MKKNTEIKMRAMGDKNTRLGKDPLSLVVGAEREWRTRTSTPSNGDTAQEVIERIEKKHDLIHLCTIQISRDRPFMRWHIARQMMLIVFRDLGITPPENWSLEHFYEWETSAHTDKYVATLGRLPTREEWAEIVSPYSWVVTLCESGADVKNSIVMTHIDLFRTSGKALSVLYSLWCDANCNTMAEPSIGA